MPEDSKTTTEFECPKCGKLCSKPQGLAVHLRQHKWYRCTFPSCEWKTKRREHLQRHLDTHSRSTDMLFHCSICSFSGQTKRTLRRHYRTCHSHYPRRLLLSPPTTTMPIRNVSQGHAATPTLTTNSTGSSSAQPSSSQLDDAILDTSVAPNNFATSLPLESWNISGQQSLALPDAPAPDAYLSPAQSTGLADGVALAQQEIVWMLNNPGLTNSLFTNTTNSSGCVNPMPEYTPVDYSAEDISTATDYHDHLLALFRNDFSNSDGVNAGLLPPSPNGLPTSVNSTSALFGADTKGSVTTVLQEDAENNEAELLFDDYIALDMLQ